MSTSPPCSFFDAEASAASTAWNTISSSTLFSREIASTSISSSRFIGDTTSVSLFVRARLSLRRRAPLALNRRPLKSMTGTRRASRNSFEREVEHLDLVTTLALFFAVRACASRQPERVFCARPARRMPLGGRNRRCRRRQDQAPSGSALAGALGQLAAKTLAALEWHLQRQLDLLAGESLEVGSAVLIGRSSPGEDTSRRS